jgi:hypothetical protein
LSPNKNGGSYKFDAGRNGHAVNMKYRQVPYTLALVEGRWNKNLLNLESALTTYQVLGLPVFGKTKLEGGCPNCGGELKTATLFMTIEERCESCDFWRPAEPAAA